ncbi:hypothetical protein K7432_008851 [Basidiobolus ranarum]|uniref:RRM domain-containing protein n=1 Tax=Basidiobolus ranarum TaxID=34480 RepID=A0ABR2VXY7_9FUNG
MRDEREKSQVSNSARVYSDSLLLKSIDISDLHELGIYIKDLPITMEAVDIKEYFSTWGHVVSCKVVNTNRMRNVKTAIVTFRPSPASLDFMSQVHQPVYHGLKGRILNVDFTVKTSTHLGLLQSGEYTKPVFYSEVISLNMGMFMNRSKFLDVWRPSDKCTMEFNLDRKLIFLNLRHIDDNYRIGIRFDDVQNRVILDTSDENMYVLYFHIVRTPFLWRQQKSNAPLPDSWCEDYSWRRAPYIIDPSVESPVYDTGVRIGEFSAYRISVPVRNSSCSGWFFSFCASRLWLGSRF